MIIYKTVQEYSNIKDISLTAGNDRLRANKLVRLEYDNKKLGYIEVKESLKFLISNL